EHLELFSAEHPAAASWSRPCLHVVDGVAAPCLLVAEREEPFPGRDGRQVLFLLCCAPAQQEGGAPEQHGRQHRLRHEPAAELLHDHHELHVAEPETVVLHRENDAEPDRKSTRLNSSHVSISYAV